MRRLLLDLNVVLDVLLDRPPHAAAAAGIWAAAERGEVEALVPAHELATIFYLATRHRDPGFARRVIEDLVAVFRVAPVDERTIRRALALGWRDFEDAVSAAAAEAEACDAIVTRDPEGFPDSPVVVVDPATAVELAASGRGPDRVAEAPPGTRPGSRSAPSRRSRRRR